MRWPLQAEPVLEDARRLGVRHVFLETCYLPGGAAAPLPPADGLALGFSWGHGWPSGAWHGLEGGRRPEAEADLLRWIERAGGLGHPLLRITLGSPATRGDEPAAALLARLLPVVRRVADHAARHGVVLAVENHGDLRAEELAQLIEDAGRPNLGVCLDTVNLLRVGDDMLAGTATLAPLCRMVQMKDHAAGDPTVPGGPLCTALGEGMADLRGVLRVLGDAGFAGPVCVELASLGPGPVDELALLARSVAWLRRELGR